MFNGSVKEITEEKGKFRGIKKGDTLTIQKIGLNYKFNLNDDHRIDITCKSS